MAYCSAADVGLLIAHSMSSGDVDSLIALADKDLDDMLGAYTLSAELKKRCSSMLTAIMIADRQPKSYSAGSARISYGERIRRWQAKVDELVARATAARVQVKVSEYQKIDEDVRYPE